MRFQRHREFLPEARRHGTHRPQFPRTERAHDLGRQRPEAFRQQVLHLRLIPDGEEPLHG